MGGEHAPADCGSRTAFRPQGTPAECLQPPVFSCLPGFFNKMKSDCLSPEGQQLSVRRSRDALPGSAMPVLSTCTGSQGPGPACASSAGKGTQAGVGPSGHGGRATHHCSCEGDVVDQRRHRGRDPDHQDDGGREAPVLGDPLGGAGKGRTVTSHAPRT